jgi:hypothetical protein
MVVVVSVRMAWPARSQKKKGPCELGGRHGLYIVLPSRLTPPHDRSTLAGPFAYLKCVPVLYLQIL